MPPKKEGKKKSSSKKSSDGNDLESSAKLQLVSGENEMLLKELTIQKELVIRLRQQISDQKKQIADLENVVAEKEIEQREITSDLGSQFKSLQAEMMARIQSLETQVVDLKVKLANAQQALTDKGKELTKVVTEKDAALEDQSIKMVYLTKEFEVMLGETMQKMQQKLDELKEAWDEGEEGGMSETTQRRLNDFHLTKLALRNTK